KQCQKPFLRASRKGVGSHCFVAGSLQSPLIVRSAGFLFEATLTIPRVGFEDIGFRFRSEANLDGHPFPPSLARISYQGRPAPRSLAWASGSSKFGVMGPRSSGEGRFEP